MFKELINGVPHKFYWTVLFAVIGLPSSYYGYLWMTAGGIIDSAMCERNYNSDWKLLLKSPLTIQEDQKTVIARYQRCLSGVDFNATIPEFIRTQIDDLK